MSSGLIFIFMQFNRLLSIYRFTNTHNIHFINSCAPCEANLWPCYC